MHRKMAHDWQFSQSSPNTLHLPRESKRRGRHWSLLSGTGTGPREQLEQCQGRFKLNIRERVLGTSQAPQGIVPKLPELQEVWDTAPEDRMGLCPIQGQELESVILLIPSSSGYSTFLIFLHPCMENAGGNTGQRGSWLSVHLTHTDILGHSQILPVTCSFLVCLYNIMQFSIYFLTAWIILIQWEFQSRKQRGLSWRSPPRQVCAGPSCASWCW